MTDLLLRDIDPILAERIRRVSVARGWDQHETILRLLEQGLFASELEVRSGFEDHSVRVGMGVKFYASAAWRIRKGRAQARPFPFQSLNFA